MPVPTLIAICSYLSCSSQTPFQFPPQRNNFHVRRHVAPIFFHYFSVAGVKWTAQLLTVYQLLIVIYIVSDKKYYWIGIENVYVTAEYVASQQWKYRLLEGKCHAGPSF